MKTNKNKKAHYEVQYLAIILVTFLLIEVMLFSIAGPADWQAGADVLDMSEAVSLVATDLADVFEPITDTVANVNQFYQLAATAMTELLDMSGKNFLSPVSTILIGVNDFYQQSADQMALLLDLSPKPVQPMVAGISISTR